MEKPLSEITRQEWILYQWQETTEMGNEQRQFIRGFQRTPDEALQAAEEWDFLASIKSEEPS